MRKPAYTTILLGSIVLFICSAAAVERHVPSMYPTIQAAIDAAMEGDVIVVAPGTYTGTGNRDIEFLDKAITIRSENGPTDCIIDCNGSLGDEHFGFKLYSNSGACTLDGFTITGAVATDFYGIGAVMCMRNTVIRNCIFRQNYSQELGAGVSAAGNCSGATPEVINCTFVNNVSENSGGAVSIFGGFDDKIIVRNCIFSDNTTPDLEVEYRTKCGAPRIYAEYSIFKSGWQNQSGITIENCLEADPCFANAGSDDYHLKSQAGRWDPNSESWVTDSVTSSCIDAGNPGCPLGDEPSDANNVRINMGAYGGTVEASKTPAGWGILADLTNDRKVDFNDLGAFVSYWLEGGECIPSDLDRDESVDFDDYAIFARQWPGADIPPAEPGVEFQITPCQMYLSETEQLDETRFTVTVEGRRIHFEDMMVANCCTPIQNLWIEMTVNGFLITIYENEELPQNPCLCICDYPVTATLGPFEAGTYILEVYEDFGGFIGSTTVIIE